MWRGIEASPACMASKPRLTPPDPIPRRPVSVETFQLSRCLFSPAGSVATVAPDRRPGSTPRRRFGCSPWLSKPSAQPRANGGSLAPRGTTIPGPSEPGTTLRITLVLFRRPIQGCVSGSQVAHRPKSGFPAEVINPANPWSALCHIGSRCPGRAPRPIAAQTRQGFPKQIFPLHAWRGKCPQGKG